MSSKADRALITFEMTCKNCMREVSVTSFRDTFHFSDVAQLMRSHNCCPANSSDADYVYERFGISTTFDAGYGLVISHAMPEIVLDYISDEARFE